MGHATITRADGKKITFGEYATGRDKIGMFDNHGNKVTESNYQNYDKSELFNTQDQALDRRYSYSSDSKSGLFGQKRKNLFGN